MASKGKPAQGRSGTSPDVATWQALAATELKSKPLASLDWQTSEGITVKPLYTPADLEAAGFDYKKDLGFPGEYPFTRGDRGAMNRGEPFVISAYSGFGEAGGHNCCQQQNHESFDHFVSWMDGCPTSIKN